MQLMDHMQLMDDVACHDFLNKISIFQKKTKEREKKKGHASALELACF